MSLRRRRRVWLRVAIYAGVALLICFAALYFLPLSSGMLDRKIERSLSRALRLNVQFDRARVFISRGLITLQNVRLADPQTPETVIQTLPRVDASGSIIALMFGETKAFSRIRIESPSRIRIVVSAAGIRAPGFDEILERLTTPREGQDLSTEQAGKRTVRVKEFEVSNGSLELISGATSATLAQFRRCTLTYSGDVEGRSRIMVRADAVEPLGMVLDGFADISTPDHYAHIEATMDRFHWEFSDEKTPPLLSCSQAAFRGDVFGYSLPAPQFNAELMLKGVSLMSGSEADQFVPKEVAVEAAGELERKARSVNVHRLQLSLPEGWVRASGRVQISSPYQYALTVERARPPQSFLDAVSERLRAHNVELKLPGNAIIAGGSAEGTLLAPGESVVRGHAVFRNASVRFGEFPQPFDFLEGELRFGNDALEVKNVSGRLGLARITGEARLTGKDLFTRPEQLEVAWAFNTPAEEVMRLAATRVRNAPDNVRLNGTIEGKGTTTINLLTPGSAATEGTIDLKDVAIDHPSLPEPLREINGEMTLENGELRSRRLAGKFMGVEFYSTGTLEGRPYFWEQPRIDATLTAEPRLETIRDIAQSRYAKIQLPPVSGKSVVQLSYTGRLDSFAFSEVWVRFAPRNWWVLLQQQPLERTLSGSGGEVWYKKGRLTANIEDARIGKNVFSLSAQGENDRLRLVVDSDAHLEDLKESLPELLGLFRARGQAHIHTTAQIRELSTIPWNELGGSEAQLPELLDHLDFLVTIETKDAAFSYYEMPEDVTDINGTFIITKNGITVMGASSQWGKSRDCLVDGTVQMEEGLPTIRFRLQSPHLLVDEWLTGWKRPPASRTGILRLSRKGLNIFGNIMADTASFGNLQEENLLGRFKYVNRAGAKQLDFEEISFEAYDGTGRIGASLKLKEKLYQLDINTKVEKMDVQKLLTDLSGSKSTASGHITGEMALHGEAPGQENLTGQGRFTVEKSRFVRNVIFEALGHLLATNIFDDIAFTTVDGEFTLAKNKVTFDNLSFQNPVLQLTARGSMMLDGAMDAYLYLVFLRETLGNVPILGDVASAIGKLGRRIIKFHFTGTVDKPKISPIPLSIDEIESVLFPKKTE